METQDILRHKPANRNGYLPTSIAVSGLKVNDLKTYRKLTTIPSKITAYFHRNKIKAVYKTDFKNIDTDYYLILAKDETIFHIEY